MINEIIKAIKEDIASIARKDTALLIVNEDELEEIRRSVSALLALMEDEE